jgi:hypothetical protein
MPVEIRDPDLSPEYFRARYKYDGKTGLISLRLPAQPFHVGHVIEAKTQFGHIMIDVVDPDTGKLRGILGHRIAWMMTYGDWPSGYLDHINGDPSDNRLCNLRVVTMHQNHMNRGTNKNNTSGAKGVHYEKNGRGFKHWRAYITLNRKRKYVGRFHTFAEACEARKVAEQKYYGQYARA